MQTVEAIIDTMGNVRVLSASRLPEDRKALVTISDEEFVGNNSLEKKDEAHRGVQKHRK